MKHRNNRKVPEKKRRDHELDLIAENRKLRKEIQQLRKQLSKMHFREEEIQEFIEEFETESHKEEVESTKYRCPKCKSLEVKVLEKIRGVDYFICGDCGNRGRLK